MENETPRLEAFSRIRYAQCWEDADILLDALNPGPGKRCLSIASAGDNTLALLARAPQSVLAIDISPAQLACLELRVAAYRALQHRELLELIGSNPCRQRMKLYRECRERLSPPAKNFWDEHSRWIESGMGGCGKFEHYFHVFRTQVLPLIHSRGRVRELLESKSRQARVAFYDSHWNSWRWRLLFRLFFSRGTMGRLGRDRAFFRYVDGSVSSRILVRARYALTELDPARNPYIQWILTGQHNGVLPFALREENFEAIRNNLDKLEWRSAALEEVTESDGRFDCFNLSDIFEYMSAEDYAQQLRRVVSIANSNARLAYWNMLVPRRRPEKLAGQIEELASDSATFFARDKAFFYSAFVLEQVK